MRAPSNRSFHLSVKNTSYVPNRQKCPGLRGMILTQVAKKRSEQYKPEKFTGIMHGKGQNNL